MPYIDALSGSSNFVGSSASSVSPVVASDNRNIFQKWWDNFVQSKTYSSSVGLNPVNESAGLASASGDVQEDMNNFMEKTGTSSSQPDASTDATGYDQAQWQYERYLELLAEQRAYNSAEAEKTRQWQERLSNTAYQRAVDDLEKAGLNKWLAVTGGNGASASTPSGASASSSLGSASVPNPEIYKALMSFLQNISTSVIRLFDIL